MNLIYITADWCGTCKALLPMVADFAATHGLPLKVLDLMDEAQGNRAESFDPKALPTLVVLRDGVEAQRFAGGFTREQLASTV